MLEMTMLNCGYNMVGLGLHSIYARHMTNE